MNDTAVRIENELKAINASNVQRTLKRLFAEILNWDLLNAQAFSVAISSPVSQSLTVTPVAHAAGLPVFLISWPEMNLPEVMARRAVQKALSKSYVEHLVCYINQSANQLSFVWARRRGDGQIELRTLPYEVGSPARTTIEQLAELALAENELTSLSISTLTDRLDHAFSVEAVTKRFFNDYQNVFHRLQSLLRQQTSDSRWAHDYALQFLNRLMFLYFIQRKRFADGDYWLGNDPRFIFNLWQEYKANKSRKDTFFRDWLSVLFFDVFNKKFHGGYQQFPRHIRAALQTAPWLNGGLFTRNELDNKHSVEIPDDFFTTLFDSFDGSRPGFLERYNFTISESTPLDIEVAVDPEMIGKVYESLVNISEAGTTVEDRRGVAGIFYTPRVEIDLMCRLSIVDVLGNYLGENRKPLLYDAVFAHDPAQKEAADRALADENLWPELNRVLRELSVCDPACGSGSFLVGMLLVLDDLQARANAQLGLEETPYERRRRIIGEQLYGVDVMDWAVHVAELRLWLQLTVETELKKAEAQLRSLLPNLSFKIRCGDSLVQEIGGINFGLHRSQLDVPKSLKGKITQLKGKKLRYYQGDTGLREEDLKKEELDLFREILTQKQHALQEKIKKLTQQIDSHVVQGELAGIGLGTSKEERHRLKEQWMMERAEKQAELARINQALQALRTTQQVPFVWDIAFVEIFEGEKKGFDIVIGNPPYVRQEMIAPPTLDPNDFGGETDDRWKEQKKAYKAKLQQSVAAAWPKFFRYKPGSTDFRKLDGKSDLYIYFYLHGLALLNPQGSFCFITSNSWLDVGYGADLQEFLLKHSHIKLILDNERKRSFVQADVNTIIALLAPPDDRRETGLDQTARFVVFKVRFEDVLDAATFKRLESAAERQSTDHWRICVRPQRDLFEEGLAREEEDDEPASAGKKPRVPFIKTARYEANKWGGKYLRAPDIFFTILEKGKGKLVRLGDIAEVRRGFTTGANEFFYLDEEKIQERGIEPEFLKPVIKSPRECRSIVIKPEDLKFKIFMCHKDKSELKGTAALEYIKWGESQKFHLRPSCRGRQRWWDLGVRPKARVNINYLVDETMRFFMKEDGFYVSDNFQEWHVSGEDFWQAGVAANSTVFQLFANITGRANFGGGLMKIQTYEVAAMEVLAPVALPLSRCRSALQHAGRIDLNSPDRRALDDVVFDVLGLTAGEREAVYEAVVTLVRARLEKARSV